MTGTRRCAEGFSHHQDRGVLVGDRSLNIAEKLGVAHHSTGARQQVRHVYSARRMPCRKFALRPVQNDALFAQRIDVLMNDFGEVSYALYFCRWSCDTRRPFNMLCIFVVVLEADTPPPLPWEHTHAQSLPPPPRTHPTTPRYTPPNKGEKLAHPKASGLSPRTRSTPPKHKSPPTHAQHTRTHVRTSQAQPPPKKTRNTSHTPKSTPPQSARTRIA